MLNYSADHSILQKNEQSYFRQPLNGGNWEYSLIKKTPQIKPVV